MFGNMRVNGNEEKQKTFPFFFKSTSMFRMLFSLKKSGIFCIFYILIILFRYGQEEKMLSMFYALNNKDYGKYGVDMNGML